MKKILLCSLVLLSFSLSSQASEDECQKLFEDNLLQQAIAVCIQTNTSASQSILGEIYDQQGNANQAKHWWELAARNGYQPARNLLASKHYYGGSIFAKEPAWPQDYAKAFKIWQEDADNGIATSQFMIGIMHYEGQSVPQSNAQAWFWLKVALQNNYKLSTDVLIELSKKITPAEKQQGVKLLADYNAQLGNK